MKRALTRTGMAGAVAGLTLASVLGTSLVAYADNIQDNITDNVASALQLVAGSSTGATAQIRLVGNNSGTDTDPGCNIDAGEPALVLDIITPTGITANPDPLSITACGTDYPVTFTASTAAVSGNVTVDFVSYPDNGRGYFNQVNIPIVVTQPQPTNTAPSVSVVGVVPGTYEIGSVPTPTCSVTDAEDGPRTFGAEISGTLTNGLGTLTATCDYTDQGGLPAPTASVTYTIVDTGKPTISHTLTPAAPNVNGWFKSSVDIDFTCNDSGSGIQSCGPDTTLGDGTDQSYTGTAVDLAGNTSTDVVTGINVDTVAPGITGVLSPAVPNGSGGWYTTTVDVDFQCDDDRSGVDTCDGDTPITDGHAGSATGTAVDMAGNTAVAVVSGVNVDTVAPTITGSLGLVKPASGWFNVPVPVIFTCGDATSGVADCGPNQTAGEGEDQSVSGTATDVAGNTRTATVSDIDVDLTAPLVAFEDGFGSTHVYGSVPSYPACVASDALSGLVSCVVTGGGTTVGEHTLVATATDRAGNTAKAELTYTVVAWTLKGFTNPVDMGGVLNTVKGGSTVPLKFEIFAGDTEMTSLAAIKSFTTAVVPCDSTSQVTDEIEVTTTGGTSLRYDTTGGQYIQNWATPKKPGTCHRVTMTTQDGSSIVAFFKLK